MTKHQPKVNDFGGAPVAEHDVVCAVCRVESALLVLNTGVFEPCWSCQEKGWRTMIVPRWLRKR